MANQFCTQCGASISADSKFCTSCGAKVEQPANLEQPPVPPQAQPVVPPPAPPALLVAPSKAPAISHKAVLAAAGQLMGNTAPAAPAGGDMVFNQAMPAMGGIIPGVELGPIKYLFGSVGRVLKGITGVFKDKKRGIPVLVISLLWLLLLMLPALGVNTSALRYLNFLTFAQGGASGGMLGMTGGLIGKGIFAYFICLFFTGGKPLAGLGRGLKNLFGSFAVKDKKALASLLAGVGLALISYNFITGTASLQNSMAGIAAFLLSLRALANRGGFLRGFIMSKIQTDGPRFSP